MVRQRGLAWHGDDGEDDDDDSDHDERQANDFLRPLIRGRKTKVVFVNRFFCLMVDAVCNKNGYGKC